MNSLRLEFGGWNSVQGRPTTKPLTYRISGNSLSPHNRECHVPRFVKAGSTFGGFTC